MNRRALYESEHEIFRESVKRFIATEVMPKHEAWEEEGQVDREVWLKAGDHGFLCPSVPEEYGGLGLDFRYNAIVDEEVMRAGATGLGWPLHSDIAVPYIVNHGTEAQKQKYLPKCVSGEIVTAIAMTEPGTGSDLQSIRTNAVRDGSDWVINGSKTFITNGQSADLVIVVAKTELQDGSSKLSLFLVESGTPGFEKGKNLKKLGMKAQDTSELFFQDVRVPESSLLGDLGKGFGYLMQELPQERLSIAVLGMGVASSILDQTVEYVRERKAFGRPVGDFQNTQFTLAQLSAEVTAMQVFTDHCVELHVNKQLDTATASKAKMLASDLQCKVCDECLQLHGGYGYMWEYPVARAFADSRVQKIYGGTNEIMKLIIARSLLA